MVKGQKRKDGPEPFDSPASTSKQTDASGFPRKRFYRQRAHANVFSDHALVYPRCPAAMDWSSHYPAFVLDDARGPDAAPEAHEARLQRDVLGIPAVTKLSREVEIADIGCGYGGLLFALSKRFPETLMLGLEIRTSVLQFLHEKILATREQHASTSATTTLPVPYSNISCVRANTMKFLPNFFVKHQLSKLFFCFPDPHFKTRKHKSRIISTTLNSEYAYVLRPGGIAYTITDVEDLHEWMASHFEAHPSFERVGKEEEDGDVCVEVMRTETEEAKKVTRNGGPMFVACFKRLADPEWPDAHE